MNRLTVLIAGLLVLIISGIPFYIYHRCFGNEIIIDNAIWGQFGDFIGGVLNPFIALISFIALLATLLYQSKEMRQNEKDRKIDEIINSLRLLENTIDPKMEHILSRQYTLPSKNNYQYRMAESLCADFKLCQTLLAQISKGSKSYSVVDFYRHKYLDIINILLDKNYISEEFKNEFFKNPPKNRNCCVTRLKKLRFT